MKVLATKTLILIDFSVLSLHSFGQNNDDEKSQNKELKKIKSESNSTQGFKENEKSVQAISIGERRSNPSKEERILAIESHIEAIDTKVAIVETDNKLKKEAEKNNWFEQMQTIREELKLELKNLQDEN